MQGQQAHQASRRRGQQASGIQVRPGIASLAGGDHPQHGVTNNADERGGTRSVDHLQHVEFGLGPGTTRQVHAGPRNPEIEFHCG
jgi:hypothetical protein